MSNNMSDNMQRAMTLAAEYRREAEMQGSNHARCREIRNEIDYYVGRWVEGKWTLPAGVREAMGLSR